MINKIENKIGVKFEDQSSLYKNNRRMNNKIKVI